MVPVSSPAPLEVYLLGLVEFGGIQQLQRRLAYDVGESGRGGALILCEHPPIITVGRAGSRMHIKPDDEDLRSAGIRAVWVNRGGGCLFHLAGQLAVYAILPLNALGLNLGGFVDGLHAVLRDVLASFDLRGECRGDAEGVYLGHARVGTVGIAVNRWITAFGATLNVGPFLGAFDLLDEPGHGGYPLRQTSMESRLQRPAPMSRVKETLIARMEARFGLERHHIYTDHPLLRPKVPTHVYVPSLG